MRAHGTGDARDQREIHPDRTHRRGRAGRDRSTSGTYVYNDVQQLRLGVATVEACAARVLVTVVARPTPERFLIDGGTKSFSADGGDGPPSGRGVS